MTESRENTLSPEDQELLGQYNASKPASSWEKQKESKKVVRKTRKRTFRNILTKPETYIMLIALIPFGLTALVFAMTGAFHTMVDDELVTLVEDPVLSSSYEELTGESLGWTESLIWLSNNPLIISLGLFAFFFGLAGVSLVLVNIIRAAKKEARKKR